MAQGPFKLFECDAAKAEAAIEFIDNLIENPPVALPAGPDESEKPEFKKRHSYIEVRLPSLLSAIEARLVREEYEKAGWARVASRTSKDTTCTVITLYAI